MPSIESRKKSLALQYLRAIAALGVVLYHSGIYLEQYRNDAAIGDVFNHSFGPFGVFSFFALSGLLMAVQANKLPDRPALFLSHRLVRIFPIFLAACLLRVIVAWSVPIGAQFDPLVLLLAPLGERDYVLGIEWTLVYEVMFYLYVFLIISLRLTRYLTSIAVAWLMAIVIFAVVRPGYAPMFPDFWLLPLSTFCAPFVFGLIIPELLKRRLVNHFYLAAGMLMVALAHLSYVPAFANIIMGLGCALIVAWAAALSEDPALESPLFARFGDWSFAIYLVHVPIMVLIYQVASPTWGSGWVWIFSMAAVLVLGAALGWADVWSYRRMKAIVDGLSQRATRGIPLAFATLFGASFVLANSGLLTGRPVSAAVHDYRGSGSLSDIDHALRAAGMTPSDQLMGSVDLVFKDGTDLRVGGWVTDRSHWMNQSRVLLFSGSAAPAVVVPRSYRGDVFRAYGLHGFLTPVAFNQRIPANACPKGAEVQAVAIDSAGIGFRILRTVKCP